MIWKGQTMAAIEPRTVTLKNGQQVCIRTPTVEDIPQIIDCLKEIFTDDRFFLLTAEEIQEKLTVEQQQQRIEEFARHPDKLLVIAAQDGCVLSMTNVEAGPHHRRRHVGTIGLSIRPDWRGIGLGTAIMQALIDWAAEHRNIEKLILGVWSKNTAAIALYKKMGFVEEGRKIRDVKYANGYYDDCVLMYKMV